MQEGKLTLHLPIYPHNSTVAGVFIDYNAIILIAFKN